MTDTDRVLAEIDDTLDGYVTWNGLSADSMCWRPEESESIHTDGAYWAPAGTLVDDAGAWTNLGYATEHAIVQPSGDGGVSIRPWVGASATVEAAMQLYASFEMTEFQRTFLNQMYAGTARVDLEADYARVYRERCIGWSDTLRQAMEGAWCTSSRLDELPAGPMYVEGYRPDNEPAPDPHWDDSLTASLERTREGASERSTFGSGRVTAPLGDALEVARRGRVEPMKEPLAVNWKVDPGKVTRKQGNRR